MPCVRFVGCRRQVRVPKRPAGARARLRLRRLKPAWIKIFPASPHEPDRRQIFQPHFSRMGEAIEVNRHPQHWLSDAHNLQTICERMPSPGTGSGPLFQRHVHDVAACGTAACKARNALHAGTVSQTSYRQPEWSATCVPSVFTVCGAPALPATASLCDRLLVPPSPLAAVRVPVRGRNRRLH